MIDEHDRERLRFGLKRALEKLDAGEASGILLIALHPDKRGVQFWEAGDANAALNAILHHLPLTKETEAS